MKLIHYLPVLFFVFMVSQNLSGQEEPQSGTIITEFGATYPVPAPDLVTNRSLDFFAVFDVSKAPEDPAVVNPYINTVARFLNMHDRAGISNEQLKAALVLHGPAAYGVLNHEEYRKRYGVDNPNLELLQALHQAEVPVILCGQTASSRGIAPNHRLDEVQIALSAMTALIQLQKEGYTLISF
ncbi:DsrE family protein [Croceiramulus getboli]|nr:DsrE family protein [Flavobacteriaceae bacterium YJPT1-3]